MKRQICALTSIFLMCICLASAQDFNNYKPIQSEGYIPADFLLLTSEKVEVGRSSTISKNEKRADRKSKEQFLIESNYLNNKLLASGRVLFNDPISKYLNEVMDKITDQNPDLKGKVRAYAVKSSSVNAFATNDGIIMVNLGLIAQLETEAQLAYILCHELIHYQNKHVINVFMENEQIDKGKGSYRGTSMSEKLISSSNYSKEVETEADMEGLKLFLKTGYSTKSVRYVFDVLHYAYLPFDDIPFEKSFFESDYLVFPKDFFLDEVSAFSPFEEEDDSRSSHPSTFKRKVQVGNKLDDASQSNGEEYLISKERFENLRKICRYELSNLYMDNEEYEMAIYNSYMLLKENPTSKYLKKTICKALYSLCKYSNNDDFYQVHTRYKKMEGSSQQLFHLMEKMSAKDRNAIAIRYAWLTSKEFPDDVDLKRITEDLMKSLVEKHYEEGFFREHLTEEDKAELKKKQNEVAETDSVKTTATKTTKKKDAGRDDEEETEDTEETEDEDEDDYSGKKLSKYDKIRKQRKEENKNGKGHRGDYIRMVFVDLYEEDAFKSKMEDFIKNKVDEDEEVDKKKIKAELKKERKIRKHGHALGISKAVIVDPFFMKLDLRKDEKMRYEKSEEAVLRYYNKINDNAKLMGLETELIGIPKMDANSVDKFNDLAFLNNWVDMRFTQIDEGMVNMESEKLKELSEKYGTNYFCWTGVINVREQNKGSILDLCLGIVYLPFAIYNMVAPNYETYFYYVTFNLETGEPVMAIYNQFDQGDAQDYINANLYDALYQLKSKRK